MLIELIQFGGLIFWAIAILVFVLALTTEEIVSTSIFVLFCVVMFCVSDLPDSITSLKNIGLYLLAGSIYWFIKLNFDFMKLKRLAKDNKINLADYYKERIPNHKLPYDMKELVLEPRFDTFLNRILLFPVGIIRDIAGEIPKAIFNLLKSTFISYRNSILGITNEMKTPNTESIEQ